MSSEDRLWGGGPWCFAQVEGLFACMSHSTGDALKPAVDRGDLGVALDLQDVLQHPATTKLVLAAWAEMRALGVDKGHRKMGVAVRVLCALSSSSLQSTLPCLVSAVCMGAGIPWPHCTANTKPTATGNQYSMLLRSCTRGCGGSKLCAHCSTPM